MHLDDEAERHPGGVAVPIDLAHAVDFPLGSLTVRPSQGALGNGERSQRLEPRVMQVLIALVRAKGATLSRDDLIAACWGEVFVSDDAVNRTISRLRRVASEFDDPFEIQTIPRVGYRLIPAACTEQNTPGLMLVSPHAAVTASDR